MQSQNEEEIQEERVEALEKPRAVLLRTALADVPAELVGYLTSTTGARYALLRLSQPVPHPHYGTMKSGAFAVSHVIEVIC